jgi:hypothetical protein
MDAAKTKWTGIYDEWQDDTWLPLDPKTGNKVTLEA